MVILLLSHRPSFLYRKYRVKPAFPAGPDPVSFKHCGYQTHISRERSRQLVQVRREHALNTRLYSLPLIKPTARQLVQDRREHALNGNPYTLPSKSQLFPRENKKSFRKQNGQTPKIWFSLGKIGLRWKHILFRGKKFVFGGTINFVLGKIGFRWETNFL